MKESYKLTEGNILKLLTEAQKESNMLIDLHRTLLHLAMIAYKHEEISRGRFIEITGTTPDRATALYPQLSYLLTYTEPLTPAEAEENRKEIKPLSEEERKKILKDLLETKGE